MNKSELEHLWGVSVKALKIKGFTNVFWFESISIYNIIILSRTHMRKGMKNAQGSTFACFTLLWMILTINGFGTI